MGWFSTLFGAGLAAPIDSIGNAVDKIFTSDDERLTKQAVLDKIAQNPALAQAAINKVEAAHRSIFVAGWRPFIGWICGVGLLNHFLIFPYLHFLYNVNIAILLNPDDKLIDLVIALLGMGTLRSIEKLRGVAK